MRKTYRHIDTEQMMNICKKKPVMAMLHAYENMVCSY